MNLAYVFFANLRGAMKPCLVNAKILHCLNDAGRNAAPLLYCSFTNLR